MRRLSLHPMTELIPIVSLPDDQNPLCFNSTIFGNIYIGQPQLGQARANSDISLLHSGQLIRAIEILLFILINIIYHYNKYLEEVLQ